MTQVAEKFRAKTLYEDGRSRHDVVVVAGTDGALEVTLVDGEVVVAATGVGRDLGRAPG